MLKAFRIVSLLEGFSYLAILSVTLGLVSREYVYFLGMGHGVLFMLYLVFSLLISGKQGWSLIVWLGLFAASIVPFAFIPVELYLKKVDKENLEEVSATS